MAQIFSQGDDAVLALTILDEGGNPIDLTTIRDAVAALFDAEGNKVISFSYTNREGYYTLTLDANATNHNVINCYLMREQSVSVPVGLYSMACVITFVDATSPDGYKNVEFQFADFTCKKGWLTIEVMLETAP